MLAQNLIDFVEFMPGKPEVAVQQNRLQPEFRRATRLTDMHVRRFVTIGAEKADSIAFGSQNCGHRFLILRGTTE